MKFKPSLLFELAVIVFFAVFVYEARDWRLQARLYPWAIGIPMLILAVIHLVSELRGGPAGAAGRSTANPVDVPFAPGVDAVSARRRAITAFCWIFGFFGAIWLFGFNFVVPAFVFAYLKFQSREGWVLSLVLTGAAWLLFWGLFVRLLSLPFPPGAVFS